MELKVVHIGKMNSLEFDAKEAAKVLRRTYLAHSLENVVAGSEGSICNQAVANKLVPSAKRIRLVLLNFVYVFFHALSCNTSHDFLWR